jgi:AraC-like DNA-binding protein
MRLSQQCFQIAALFDSLNDVVAWIKDRDGRYQWVNRTFLINYSLDDHCHRSSPDVRDVLGKTDYDLSPTFLANQFRLDDDFVLTGKRIVDRIELVGQPDGLAIWNVTNKIPLFDDAGAIVGTAGITRKWDVAERARTPGSEFGPVLAYLRDHFRTPITNRQLARLAHMSVRSFERRFHSSFHLTPQKYLRKLRLSMASRALVYTAKPLAEVATECGFSDQSHFTRAFREQFGATPGDYRERYALRESVAAPVPNVAAEEQEPARSLRL